MIWMATTVTGRIRCLQPQRRGRSPGGPAGRHPTSGAAVCRGRATRERDGEEAAAAGWPRRTAGCEMPTNAAGRGACRTIERGRIADEDADRQADGDADARRRVMPSTSVLAIAFLSSGHTGRLPLIELPQSNVTKLQPAEVLRDDVAVEAVGLLVLLDLRLGGPRVDPEVALPPDRCRCGSRMKTRNVMKNSVGIAHSTRRNDEPDHPCRLLPIAAWWNCVSGAGSPPAPLTLRQSGLYARSVSRRATPARR